MATSKPKVGGRVVWQFGNMPKEFGTIVHVVGQKIEVRWDNPPPYHEPEDTFTYDLTRPGATVTLWKAA